MAVGDFINAGVALAAGVQRGRAQKQEQLEARALLDKQSRAEAERQRQDFVVSTLTDVSDTLAAQGQAFDFTDLAQRIDEASRTGQFGRSLAGLETVESPERTLRKGLLQAQTQKAQAATIAELTPKPPEPIKPGTQLQFLKEANEIKKPFNQIQEQFTTMDVALRNAIGGGTRLATDDAIIQTFLKIIDPTSVVREGEFDRLRGGAALVDRAKAMIQRVGKGGQLPIDVLDGIRKLGFEMVQAKREIINNRLNEFRNLSQASGLDPNLVAPSIPEFIDPSPVIPRSTGRSVGDDAITEHIKSLELSGELPNFGQSESFLSPLVQLGQRKLGQRERVGQDTLGGIGSR